MDLFTLIKNYGKGQGVDAMWKAVSHISDFVEKSKDAHPDEYQHLIKLIYADMAGDHFNEEFANEQISKMYYKDESGVKHYGPFWTEEKMRKAYEVASPSIPSAYNEWDFRVTLNMIKSDNAGLLDEWFPDATEEENMSYVIDMAINFLDDEDAPHPKSKIWSYFN